MTELEFLDSIDCRLPYRDLEKVQGIIEKAKGYSSNAVFMVLHEISRLPRGEIGDLDTLLVLLAAWSSSIEHPLKATLLPIAESMIRGKAVSTGAAMMAMRAVANFPEQYCALAIPYFSCDDDDGEVDALHESIKLAWAGA